MDRRLVVIEGNETGKIYELPESGVFLIGRSTDTGTKLTDARVSRKHCQIEVSGTTATLTDSSTTGTFVDRDRISGPHLLRRGQVIRVGDTAMRYEFDGEEDIHNEVTFAGRLPIPIEQQPTLGGDALAALVKGGAVAAPAPSPAVPMSELIGTTVGRHTVHEFLAEGLATVLFRAHDNTEDRPVALKVFKVTKSEGEIDALARSLEKVLPLRHANLVAIYDVSRNALRSWLAEEFIDGESLDQVIGRHAMGMLEWPHALRCGMHMAKGLQFMHRSGVVHGNLAPRYVLINNSDKVAKVGGLLYARTMEAAREKPRSRPDELLLNVGYRAPERVRGDLYADVRSDVYCLGATMYALLTGRPPFEGATPVDVLTRLLQPDSAPPRPKEFQFAVPDAFERIILRMLAKRPEDRYPGMTEVLADLERIVGSSPVEVREPESRDRKQPPRSDPQAQESTIAISCGSCGQKLRPRRKFIGSQVKCPTCKVLLLVPEEPGVAQPVPQLVSRPVLTKERARVAEPPPAPTPTQGFSKPVVVIVAVVIVVFGILLYVWTNYLSPGPKPTDTEHHSPAKTLPAK